MMLVGECVGAFAPGWNVGEQFTNSMRRIRSAFTDIAVGAPLRGRFCWSGRRRRRRRGSGDVRRAKYDRRNLVTFRTAHCNRRFPASFNPSLMKEFAISSCTQYLKPMSPLFFFLSKVTASGNKHMNTAITLLKPTAASNQKKIERWYRFLHLLGFILLSDTFLSHLSTCPM